MTDGSQITVERNEVSFYGFNWLNGQFVIHVHPRSV